VGLPGRGTEPDVCGTARRVHSKPRTEQSCVRLPGSGLWLGVRLSPPSRPVRGAPIPGCSTDPYAFKHVSSNPPWAVGPSSHSRILPFRISRPDVQSDRKRHAHVHATPRMRTPETRAQTAQDGSPVGRMMRFARAGLDICISPLLYDEHAWSQQVVFAGLCPGSLHGRDYAAAACRL
jgi:hypothetical protein